MPLPTIGSHLRIRDGSDAVYRSRLVEATDSHYFIELPLQHETNVPLDIIDGREVTVEFHAQDGSICRFAAIKARLVNTPVLCWEIEKPAPKNVHREQRRNFVRVQVDLPVRIRYANKSLPPVDCYTRDMSGGGLAIVAPKTMVLSPGSTIELSFTLPLGNYPITVQGFIIRVSEPNESGFRLVSVQFLDMPESVRQRIIQFIFNRQRQIT